MIKPVFLLVWLSGVAARNYCLPHQPCWPTPSEIYALKFRLSITGGKLLTPRDDDWPGNKMMFNPAVYKEPGLIVNALTANHVKVTLKFAFTHNIRVSVYSTGHDLNGRSVAYGSLQISVHQMKNISIDMNCKENGNGDGCMMVQSGVQFSESYKAASDVKRMVLGGSCLTVGVTGWTLGGGISPFVRTFGLGIQNVVEFHLVTADLSEVWTRQNGTTVQKPDGSIYTSNDSSLFYALRGGGGGSFGVVVDMKYKMYKDRPIEFYSCSFPAFTDGTPKVFEIILKSLTNILKDLPSNFGADLLVYNDCNSTINACNAFFDVEFHYYGTTGNTSDARWFDKLENLKVYWAKQGLNGGVCRRVILPGYHSYALQGFQFPGGDAYMGGSLVQKDLYSNETINLIVNHINDIYQQSSEFFLAYNLLGGEVSKIRLEEFPIHKGWKNALAFVLSANSLPTNNPQKSALLISKLKDFHKKLDVYSSGKYFNEVERDLAPDQWKSQFWGLENYRKLLKIKRKWDPQNRFTCHQCVGHDLNTKDYGRNLFHY